MERCTHLLALFPDGMGEQGFYFVVLDTTEPKVGPRNHTHAAVQLGTRAACAGVGVGGTFVP